MRYCLKVFYRCLVSPSSGEKSARQSAHFDSISASLIPLKTLPTPQYAPLQKAPGAHLLQKKCIFANRSRNDRAFCSAPCCIVSKNGHNCHDPGDREDAGDEGKEPAAPDQVFLIVSAVFHHVGDSGGWHRRHECGERSGLNQDNQPTGIASDLIAGRTGNGKEQQHRAAVRHKLSKRKGEKEKQKAYDIIVVDLSDQAGNETADQVARAGAREGPRHGERTDNEQQHAQRDCLPGLLRLQHAEQHCQNRTDKTYLPDCEGFQHSGLEHKSHGSAEENGNPGCLRKGGQRRSFSMRLLLSPGGIDGVPIRAKARHDKSTVDDREDQHRQPCFHGLKKADRRYGSRKVFQLVIIGADIAVELGCLGGAVAYGQCAAGADGNRAKGQRKLRPGNTHGISGGHA